MFKLRDHKNYITSVMPEFAWHANYWKYVLEVHLHSNMLKWLGIKISQKVRQVAIISINEQRNYVAYWSSAFVPAENEFVFFSFWHIDHLSL